MSIVIRPFTSKEAIGYSVVYIPLHEGVKDLHHLTFKRYSNNDNNVYIGAVGIRINPSVRMSKDIVFPRKQSGIIVFDSEDSLDKMFGDEWEGILLNQHLGRRDTKYILYDVNSVLESYKRRINFPDV